jgi:hypothetical protein
MSAAWIYATDEKPYPEVEGWYALLLPGDTETVDGMTMYSYPDYIMFFELTITEDGPMWEHGIGDDYGFLAWAGPYDVPKVPK